jgi:hypothetical protein
MWPAGAPNPFVWSYDASSYGTHADYLFGWKGDSLQRAMNKSECFYDGCGSLKKQPMATANNCKVKDMVGEQTGGCESQHFSKLLKHSKLTISRAGKTAWQRLTLGSAFRKTEMLSQD